MARPTISFPKLEEDGPEFFKVFMPTLSSQKLKLCFTRGWEGFVSKYKLERGDFLLFKSIGNSCFRVKIYAKNGCKKELAAVMNNIINHDPIPNGKMKEGSSSGLGEDKSNIKIGGTDQFVPPKNLRFVVTLYNTRASLYSVVIPRILLIGINTGKEIKLRYGNKKSWTVGITSKTDGRGVITTNWVEFRRANNLKEGDMCVFDLVVGKDNTCKEMIVSIIDG
ncbi:B3 DNA binding domain containing protein [Parasponia andersonii]|uniref:B3 DNA binding domain containing protein n=1 Tax=Parasponia andersonii TaxID=3476 RepID=A0A2P5BWN3_PARAD|nr:B3 DNA binding domain containing protein [Parasponia andersonii]